MEDAVNVATPIESTENTGNKPAPVFIAIGIVQLLIAAAILYGRIKGFDGDAKVRGDINAAATFASGAIFIALSILYPLKPILSAILALVSYVALLIFYISAFNADAWNFARGDWGLWTGWVNVAVLLILTQTLRAAIVAQRHS